MVLAATIVVVNDKVRAYIREHWAEQSDLEMGRALGVPYWVVRYQRQQMGLLKQRRSAPPEDGLSETEKYERQISALRSEIARLSVALRREREAAARLDQVVDAITQSVPAIKWSTQKLAQPKGRRGAKVEVACLCLADLHFGQHFRSDEMGGINEYSLEVAQRRLATVTQKALQIATEHIRAASIEVFVLGDLVSGGIHDELEATDEPTVPEQAIAVADALQLTIRELAGGAPVHVTAVSGNHGRIRRRKWTARRQYESWDYVAVHMAAQLLRHHKGVQWEIPRSPWTVRNVLGYRILLSHGDHVRSSTSWGGIPFYGLSRDTFRRRVLYAEHDIYFDLAVMGHFHQFALVPLAGGLRVLLAPSIVGPDPYSDTLAAGSRPAAALFGVAEGIGMTSLWELHAEK